MKPRRRNNMLATVSLFPFLAVLICTFGVLIVLLVLMVKSADHKKQMAVESENDRFEESLTALNDVLELQQIRVEGLESVRPDLLKKLADEKNERASLTDQIKEIQERLELISDSVKRIEINQQVTSQKQEEATELLKQQLAVEEQRLATLLDKAEANQSKLYSIVPYEGVNGTTRRPVFVECTAEGLILQPYGIRITATEFGNAKLPGNPLDSALVAVREYFIKYELVEENGYPYPLLIVRPDGAESYVVARHALGGWDDEFGYELVSADKEIDFGNPDPQLETLIRDAVNQAKQRSVARQMRMIEQNVRRKEQSNEQVGLTASSQFGGFVGPSSSVEPANYQSKSSNEKQDQGNRFAFQSHSNTDAQNNQSGPQNIESIADERGKDWALPTKSPGDVGYLRPVPIRCQSDRIIIESAQGDQVTAEIRFGDSPQQAIEQLVEQLWKKIDSWGIAGVNGFWRPHLKVYVEPDAIHRFEQIRALLQNSGLEIEAIQP